MTVQTREYTINPPDYNSAIMNEDSFYIQFHSLTEEVDSVIIKTIRKYLEKYDLLYLKDILLTIIKELVNNAVKANVKRIYFKMNNLDIEKIEDYRNGMESFKRDTYQTEDNDLFDKLEKSNLIVRINFKTTDKFLHINIINNIPIIDVELKKIESRIAKAYGYSDISEAFEDVLDDSEGAGLGLIMALMLLKNTGLSSDHFKLYKKDDLTIATLTIPKIFNESKKEVEIADEILKELDDIPTFPENIKKIQGLCSNPDVDIKEIAYSIAQDPGITSSILKLANSAGYVTMKRIDSIEEAIKIIGIKGINTLLIATGVHNIIDSRYKKFEAMWKNSYKRAFYAQKIAIQMNQTKVSEFAYLGSLLADIGRMVLLSVKPELISRLRDIAGFKGMENTDLIEEITIGMSHSSLGAMIGRKWKFNEALIQSIELHHRPFKAEKKYRQLVYIVYLAEVFIEIENRKMRFEIIDENVLDFFRINDKEKFNRLHNILMESYDKHKEVHQI